jgi:ubiquitin-conjugating enzyme E2 H
MLSRRVARDIDALRKWAAANRGAVVMDESEPRYVTFFVDIDGPADSLYEGASFTVRCQLPQDFPMKSPSVCFQTRMWHPNIERDTGSVCLDVLRQRWTPVTTLVMIFSVYLPQLLLYPEPSDPFNEEAAKMMAREPELYAAYVRAHVAKYARGDAAAVLPTMGADAAAKV